MKNQSIIKSFEDFIKLIVNIINKIIISSKVLESIFNGYILF
jgi:hypothetical protein